jgi:hypothetical protein
VAIRSSTRLNWDDHAQSGILSSVRTDLQADQKHDASGLPQAPGGDLDPSTIRSAVDRIGASRAMSGCHRLMQLLNFVVASTLRGEAEHLKETTIGVAVFGRSPDYDPKVDTIVRSQAWRLRSKLRKYYSGEGANDPVVIDVPVGHYVPVFHTREETGIRPCA